MQTLPGLNVKALQAAHLELDIYKQEVVGSSEELASHRHNLSYDGRSSAGECREPRTLFAHTSICCFLNTFDNARRQREEGGHVKERTKP